MKPVFLVAGFGLFATAAMAELKDEEHIVGDQMVSIEFIDPVEIMWVGRNQYERTQVLSGQDIEIAAFATDADAAAMLSARAIVAVAPGTHSCDEGEPREYYVVTLGEPLATDGPLTTCVELAVSVTPGAIVLEEDPMGEGEFWSWAPGEGFNTAAN
ncbi:hypothetical protein [Tabrizicola sp.]|uniref:hypothetical protein n=1 Tax=Tabrizicola sp. TaxID=2005166 RepID=UPI003F2AC83B